MTTKRNKGNSLLKFVDEYVALDLETTGLDPSYDEIIEIGAVRVKDNRVVDSFSSLVMPTPYEYLDEDTGEYVTSYVSDFISELTGITDDMLSTAPSIDVVLPTLLNFVGDSIVIGHNVNFDINFICDTRTKLYGSSFMNDFIDTMRLSRRLFPEERHHRLKDVIKRFHLANKVEHRALGDAIQAHKCYEHLKSHVLINNIDLNPVTVKKRYSVRAKDIQATVNEFDESHPFYGKICVFTGILEKMPRREAMQLVVNIGGICGDTVTKKTNYLILGNNDYCKTIKDGKSTKQKKAEGLILAGTDLEILSENIFYEIMEGTYYDRI